MGSTQIVNQFESKNKRQLSAIFWGDISVITLAWDAPSMHHFISKVMNKNHCCKPKVRAQNDPEKWVCQFATEHTNSNRGRNWMSS